MDENERTIKQNYLRNEIVEKGFDSEQFINFLCEIKGEEAADIDIWSLDELKDAVVQFKERVSKEQYSGSLPSNSKTPNQTGDSNVSNPDNAKFERTATMDSLDNGPMPKDVKYN